MCEVDCMEALQFTIWIGSCVFIFQLFVVCSFSLLTDISAGHVAINTYFHGNAVELFQHPRVLCLFHCPPHVADIVPMFIAHFEDNYILSMSLVVDNWALGCKQAE